MREVLYVSERKLNSMFLDFDRFQRNQPQMTEITLGVPSIASAKFSLNSTELAGPTDSAALAKKLERVINRLEKAYTPAKFTDPNLRGNQWIKFDLEMIYGTAHEDSKWPTAIDDVVLFGGSAPSENSKDQRPVDLLLCGSANHLRDRIARHGRMGSTTDWLHDLIIELERRDRSGVHVIPEFLVDIVSPRQKESQAEWIAHEVFGGLMRSAFPWPDRGRLRGHARVLLNIDDPQWFTRLVLATPLYVEIPPPNPLGIWRKLTQRLGRISERTVSLDPGQDHDELDL